MLTATLSTSEAATPPRRKRWIPLSLKMFAALLVLLVGGGMWIGVRAYRQHGAIREIRRLGGRLTISEIDGYSPWMGTPPGWLRRHLGNDVLEAFGTVLAVTFGGIWISDSDSLINVDDADGPTLWLNVPQSAFLADLTPLTDLPGLKRLDFGNWHLNDSESATLANLHGLLSLNLRGTEISDAGLANLRGLTNLEELNLEGTQVTEAGLVYLRQMRHLEKLTLPSSFEWTDAGLATLGQLAGPPDLAVISGREITDIGLARLRGMQNLKRLSLGNKVTDDGLAQLRRMTNLTTLYIGGGSVTDAGVKDLAGMSALRWLNLSHTQITDAGLIHLKDLHELWYLVLDGTRITDAGLRHLEKLGNLETLYVRDTAVTAEGITRFNESKPRTTVHRGEHEEKASLRTADDAD